MEWISVEDRLPDRPEMVLCVVPSGARGLGMYMAHKERECFMFQGFGADGIHAVDEVTHWMPFPDPPKLT